MKKLTTTIGALLLCASTAFGLQHKTRLAVEDITDPETPRVLWQGENVIDGCGVRNMLALAIGATDMGAATGSTSSMGQLCAGTNGLGEQLVPEATGWNFRIASGGNGLCVGSGSVFPCCTGTAAGCSTFLPADVITFAEGQKNTARSTIETNYANAISGGNLSIFSAALIATRSLYWDGGSLMGARFYAVADGSTANINWCEYALRTGGVLSGQGALGVNVASVNYRSGWQLNHKIISGCINKTSGQILQITGTITWQ